MEYKFPYTFQSEEASIPWVFIITFAEGWVSIQGMEPERNRIVYDASLSYRSGKIDWNRLPTTTGLRNDKLYPIELRTYIDKLLTMKAFW